MRGITFDGKHSFRDFDLTIAPGRNIGNPSKIKRKERVPFSNVEYDFSNIYGGQEYTERPLNYTLNVIDKHNYSKDHFSIMKIAILNWLMGPSGKGKLTDDAIPGYYFLAEVENGPELEEHEFDGTLAVEFTAYPFKISELEEGHDIWDEFNFLLDYAQITDFEVSGSKDVILYNPGTQPIKPKIQSSSGMEITKDNVIFNIPAGQSESYDFILMPGENKFRIQGNGSISFHFRKELI